MPTEPAPIDPVLLERVLQPPERARSLPGQAYTSPAFGRVRRVSGMPIYSV
jgi:hypothetical protein